MRLVGGEALVKIVRANPEARDECVGVLTQQLEQFTKNSSELNGFLIADLLDLKAVESAPIMEQAFAAKRVDTSIAGGWLDVQIDLGLKTYSEVREIRRTVDAEHLGSKAAKPIAEPPRGFGSSQGSSVKKGNKKGK